MIVRLSRSAVVASFFAAPKPKLQNLNLVMVELEKDV